MKNSTCDLIEKLKRLAASDYKREGREAIPLYILKLTKEEKETLIEALEKGIQTQGEIK